MNCKACRKPFLVIRQSFTDFELLCKDYPDELKVGWVCPKCKELWYVHEGKCDCGTSKPNTPQIAYFIDSKVKSNRSLIMTAMVNLKRSVL